MKIVSEEYKKAITTMGRQTDSKITYTLGGITTELGSDELNSVNPYFEGSILKSIMKGLDIDSNVNIPVGTILNYKFGVLTNNGYEYIDYGEYVVKTSDKQENERSYLIKCYDKMIFSMKPYKSLGVTYPINLRDYLVALCSKLGLQFANVNDTFTNYDKFITAELYLDKEGNSLNYTFRDIFDELSQAIGENIGIVGNKIGILNFKDTNVTISEKWLKDKNVNFGKKFGPVNSIVLNRDEDKIFKKDDSSIAKNGLCEIEIKNNQILNWNNRDTFLNGIFNKLNGLEFYLNDFSTTGITFLEFGDKYNIQIGNEIYNCIMLSDDTRITQGIEEDILTEEPSTSETDYTKSDTTDRRLNRTILIVNKQEQSIKTLINEVGDRTNKETSITEDLDSIESKVKNTGVYKDTIRGDNRISTSKDTAPTRILTLEFTSNYEIFNQIYCSDNEFTGEETI